MPDQQGGHEETNFQQTWSLQQLQACWQRGLTGMGVQVGHLDTGVDGDHPELSGRIAAFMEFDAAGSKVLDAAQRDSGSHGTHTASIICGQSVGVAPGAVLCAGMVIEGGKCLVRVLAGLDWLLDCQVRVLCLSVGIPFYTPLFEILLNRMKKAGILIVAPVGNRGAGRTCSPANYPGVLAVGAMNARERVAHFSGSCLFTRARDHVKPNLVAPGVDILAAAPGGGYQHHNGTSMAAAYVAGVAALLFQARPEASAEEVEQAILTTCTPLAGSGGQRYGRGQINPLPAVEALLAGRGGSEDG